MRVGSVDAPQITFDTAGSVSDPKLGEEGADIFEFKIKGDNDEDVVLRTITFEGSNDAEDDLMNFELYYGNDLVASTSFMKDDYLTFDLGDGIVIEEDKTEDFTVKADIVEGAGDTIGFSIDQALDVTAQSTKFGYGASVDLSTNNVSSNNAFGTFKIQAGELTLTEINSEIDKIREDKENVVLGKVKVTNVAGQNLELQRFGARLAVTPGTSGVTQLSQVFEDIELYNEETGSSYELTLDGTDDLDAVFSDNNIDVVLPQGATVWAIRADTVENITSFDQISVDVSFSTGDLSSTTGGFYVEETEDDTEVTDITPSSVSFNTIDGSESAATLSTTPLANVTVVRGADDIVALQFEVEADESSDIVIDEIAALVQENVDTAAVAADNQEISQVALYQGSVSESNLIDTESGSKLGAGVATFDDFDDITISANDTETFIVTVSFVDGQDAVDNSTYRVSLSDISIEDDENDDITPTPAATTIVSARQINVTGFGQLTVTEDGNNDDNEDPKTILAGNSEVVFSVDVQAINESMKVEEVVFTLSSGTDLRSAIVNASLYLDDTLIDTNTNSNINEGAGTITFDDISDLVIEESTSELRLSLNTDTIGFQKVGKSLAGLTVTNVALNETEGEDSGKDGVNVTEAITAAGTQAFSIVPSILTPSVTTSLNASAAPQIRVSADAGNNTKNESNSTPNTVVTEVRISTLGTSIAGGGTFTLSNVDDSSDTVTGAPGGANEIIFDVDAAGASGLAIANRTVSDGGNETFKITVTGTADGDTVSIQLPENGITYDVQDSNGAVTNADTTGATINLSEELDLGTRSY